MAENKRKWYLIDAKGKALGRLASEIAILLRGKNLVEFTPHLDLGGYVVVINTDQIKMTGKKVDQKKFFRFSGYPGGIKEKRFIEAFTENSGKVLWETVKNMLPANKLRINMLKRIKSCKGADHAYDSKLK